MNTSCSVNVENVCHSLASYRKVVTHCSENSHLQTTQ